MRACALALALLLLASILASLSPYPRDAVNLPDQRNSPSWQHPFGTDDLGRDTLTRTLHAGRISLSVAILATLTSLLVGVGLGLLAGFKGGPIDALIMALVDVALAMPIFLLLLFLSAASGGGFWLLAILIGLASWMPVARLVRTSVLTLREREFVQAARGLGLGDARILLRHILPNTVSPILVAASLGAAQAMLIESALSYLGFGVQPPTPTWGNMLREAQEYFMIAPWNAVFPGLFIFVTALNLHVLGEKLRERLDPKTL